MTLDQIEKLAVKAQQMGFNPVLEDPGDLLALVAAVRAADKWLAAHDAVVEKHGTAGFEDLVRGRESFRAARAKLD